MAVEILVLGREKSLFHQRRDGVGWQIKTPLMRIFGEQRAVTGMNAGHDRRFVILQLRIIRQVLGIDVDQSADAQRGDNEKHSARRENETKEPGEHPHEQTFRNRANKYPRRMNPGQERRSGSMRAYSIPPW